MKGVSLLKVSDVNASYDGAVVLRGVSLEVGKGEIVTIIGPNGVGKTTILRTIMGQLHPDKGKIKFQDERIDELATNQIIKMGISLSPEEAPVFSTMSVLDNLRLGAYTVESDKEIEKRLKDVFEMFPPLEDRKNQVANTLSGGERQMLSIGRGMMTDPDLLMLDEPSLGLAPNLVSQLFKFIDKIKETKTVLLVEQNARRALKTADRGYVLDEGRIVLEDTGKKLLKSPRVKEAYIGG